MAQAGHKALIRIQNPDDDTYIAINWTENSGLSFNRDIGEATGQQDGKDKTKIVGLKDATFGFTFLFQRDSDDANDTITLENILRTAYNEGNLIKIQVIDLESDEADGTPKVGATIQTSKFLIESFSEAKELGATGQGMEVSLQRSGGTTSTIQA